MVRVSEFYGEGVYSLQSQGSEFRIRGMAGAMAHNAPCKEP